MQIFLICMVISIWKEEKWKEKKIQKREKIQKNAGTMNETTQSHTESNKANVYLIYGMFGYYVQRMINCITYKAFL